MKSWGISAHYGDLLWGLAYLMRCEGEHLYHVPNHAIPELQPLASNSNVHIRSIDNMPPNTEDVWIANGRHEGSGVIWGCQEDIIHYVQSYFNCFGKAWEDRSQMLFDFPWLKKQKHKQFILVLNTNPQSGQCPGYSQEEMGKLSTALRLDHYDVIDVVDEEGGHSYSLTQIAVLSSMASMIIGGASGPFFVTMNTSAADVPRIVLLDPMRLDYGPDVGPIHNVKNAEEARGVLKSMGFFRYQ